VLFLCLCQQRPIALDCPLTACFYPRLVMLSAIALQAIRITHADIEFATGYRFRAVRALFQLIHAFSLIFTVI
jgi:hypothetical protein